jgi:hypothetical protein
MALLPSAIKLWQCRGGFAGRPGNGFTLVGCCVFALLILTLLRLVAARQQHPIVNPTTFERGDGALDFGNEIMAMQR